MHACVCGSDIHINVCNHLEATCHVHTVTTKPSEPRGRSNLGQLQTTVPTPGSGTSPGLVTTAAACAILQWVGISRWSAKASMEMPLRNGLPDGVVLPVSVPIGTTSPASGGRTHRCMSMCYPPFHNRKGGEVRWGQGLRGVDPHRRHDRQPERGTHMYVNQTKKVQV